MPEQGERVWKARSMLFRYLSYRARTCSEAAAYLARKGYTEREISKAIKGLQEMGYFNDESFTRDFISYRKARFIGPKRIKHELANKGLDKRTIDELLTAENDEQEELRAIDVLLEKRMPANGVIDQKWLVRQAAFLQRRGFRDRLILSALKAHGFGE